jgi:predicted secreted protein
MEQLELRVHGTHTVALKSLASAGYRWSVAVDNPKVVAVERLAGAARTEEPSGGNSRDELFALTGLAAGETVVRFTQARSFERGKPAHAVHVIEVRVS